MFLIFTFFPSFLFTFVLYNNKILFRGFEFSQFFIHSAITGKWSNISFIVDANECFKAYKFRKAIGITYNGTQMLQFNTGEAYRTYTEEREEEKGKEGEEELREGGDTRAASVFYVVCISKSL